MSESSIAVFTLLLGVMTFSGTAIAYFVQRSQEKHNQDRQQALERVRSQLSVFVGPVHQLYRTFITVFMNYAQSSGHGLDIMLEAYSTKGEAYWMPLFKEEFLQAFIDHPNSFEAQCYRNFVSRRLKPLYTRIREIVLAHGSNLADLPSEEEWLTEYEKADVTSVITGSFNANAIFDAYSAWTLEFDDIVESWGENDFRRMQPFTEVNWFVYLDLVHILYDNAKTKEATYNKHVKVPKNVMNTVDKNKFVDFLIRKTNQTA